jgi:hypothetical protein
MTGLVASRHNIVIRAYKRRLRDRGEAPKVALGAVHAKLLTILKIDDQT